MRRNQQKSSRINDVAQLPASRRALLLTLGLSCLSRSYETSAAGITGSRTSAGEATTRMAAPPVIEGVATSTTAFVGLAAQGPLHQAIPLRSFDEFVATFGKRATGVDLGLAIELFFLNGGRRAVVVRVSDLRLAEIAGNPSGRRGIFALDSTDEIGLLVIPGVHDPRVWDAVTSYGRARQLFTIFDLPADAESATAIEDFIVQSGARASDRAALYAPWLVVPDPVDGAPRVVPPSGAVAGICARFDEQFGVWKSPAGVDATIEGISGLAVTLSDTDLTALGDIGVNGLRSLPGGGDVVWGAKTFHGDDAFTAEARFVSVRRLTLYLEASIGRGIAWAVFEPNDEPLWRSIRVQVEEFLHALWREGAFAGQRPGDAFFVRCDTSTMTQVEIDRGILRVLVGFAPLQPAEFVIFEIQQQTAT